MDSVAGQMACAYLWIDVLSVFECVGLECCVFRPFIYALKVANHGACLMHRMISFDFVVKSLVYLLTVHIPTRNLLLSLVLLSKAIFRRFSRKKTRRAADFLASPVFRPIARSMTCQWLILEANFFEYFATGINVIS